MKTCAHVFFSLSFFQSGIGHQGGKPARAVYLRDGRIFSTGFSKMAERQYAVWDEVCFSDEELKQTNSIDLFLEQSFCIIDNGRT